MLGSYPGLIQIAAGPPTPPVDPPTGDSDVALVWETPSHDMTPSIGLRLPPYAAAGDVIDIDYGPNITFTGATRITRTIDLADLNSPAGASVSIGAQTPGYKYARAFLTHNNVAGTWSEPLTLYLDATAPTITSPASLSIAENATLALTLSADEPVTFSLSGPDAALFEVVGAMPATSAVLRILANGTLDFETPRDAGGINIYNFTVTARDRGTPGLTASQPFALTVTNVADGSPYAPGSVSPPVASGSTVAGGAVSTTNGVWSASPAPSFAYQWKRDGVNIAGATASTYTLVTADIGPDITCDVTATNAIGSSSAASNAIYTWTPDLLYSAIDAGDWFYANDTALLWQDTGTATPVASADDPVGHWRGKKNGRNAIQAVADRKPLWKANGVLATDGSNDILVDSTGGLGIYAAGQCSVFVVGKYPLASMQSQDTPFCEGSSSSNVPIFTPIVAKTSSLKDGVPNIRDDAGAITINEASIAANLIDAFDGDAHFILAVDDGGGITGYVDNVEGARRTYTSRSALTSNIYSLFGRWLAGTGSTYLAGETIAIGAIGRQLTLGERAKLQTWAQNEIARAGL